MKRVYAVHELTYPPFIFLQLFAVALLASGQNSTLTGTLAGQIVMEGFLRWKLRPFVRRFITRIVAIVPAVVATVIGGPKAVNYLLILSQVILSFALPFAIFPLVHITSNKAKMGDFANWRVVTIVAYTIGFMILALNIFIFV
jgi:manganese transport protein